VEKKRVSARWMNEEKTGGGELITRMNDTKWREVTLAFPRAPPHLPPACAGVKNSPAITRVAALEPGSGETKELLVSPDAGGEGVEASGGPGCRRGAGNQSNLACTPWAWLGQKTPTKRTLKNLTLWVHGCMCYFACHATFAMIGGPPKEVKLMGCGEGERKRSKVGWGPPKLTPIITSWRC
jgi:hypothetical protein